MEGRGGLLGDSAIKRIFGEYVTAGKFANMVKEMIMKAFIYIYSIFIAQIRGLPREAGRGRDRSPGFVQHSSSRNRYIMTHEHVDAGSGIVARDISVVNLREEDLPDYWYNILPRIPDLPPPLMDGKSREVMERVLPTKVLQYEFSTREREPIPEELRGIYLGVGRPTPLMRARRLEEYLGGRVRIYMKMEGYTFAGSHKTNSAVAHTYFAEADGAGFVTTETGAGQWGSAVALGAALNGIGAHVFMVAVSYRGKPYRRYAMQMYGAQVHSSPSELTRSGPSS